LDLFGEAACLAAAALWAMSVEIFREPVERFGAAPVNTLKCTIATLLLGATTLAFGSAAELGAVSGSELTLVAASGLVGLTLGDTALFGAVARLGTHRTLLLQTLAPVFTAVIAFLWKGEVLGTTDLLGTAIILGGVVLVVLRPDERGHAGEEGVAVPQVEVKSIAASVATVGVVMAVVAAFGQGSGVVLAKAGMAHLSPLPAAFLRLTAAAVGLLMVGAFDGGASRARRALKDRDGMRRILPASVMGTYIAMLLMMTGIALAPAAIAAVLLATTPIFGLIVDAVTGRGKVDARGIAGTLAAVAGVAILRLA